MRTTFINLHTFVHWVFLHTEMAQTFYTKQYFEMHANYWYWKITAIGQKDEKVRYKFYLMWMLKRWEMSTLNRTWYFYVFSTNNDFGAPPNVFLDVMLELFNHEFWILMMMLRRWISFLRWFCRRCSKLWIRNCFFLNARMTSGDNRIT